MNAQQTRLGMLLTDRQRVAMQYPCWRANEAVNQRFLERHKDNWSSVLTINK